MKDQGEYIPLFDISNPNSLNLLDSVAISSCSLTFSPAETVFRIAELKIPGYGTS